MLSRALSNETWQHLIASLGWLSVLKELVPFVVAANSGDYPNHSFELEWPLIIDYQRQETKLLALYKCRHKGRTSHLCVGEKRVQFAQACVPGELPPPRFLSIELGAWLHE